MACSHSPPERLRLDDWQTAHTSGVIPLSWRASLLEARKTFGEFIYGAPHVAVDARFT
jgi:hypothetical protein